MIQQVKLPPQNLDAERSVLGSILIDSDSIINILEFLKSEDFYDSKNGIVYEACVKLYEKGTPIDILTLTDSLKKSKNLQKIGGASYLSELVSMVPTSANIEDYGKIIKENSIRRQLIRLGAKMGDLAFKEDQEMQDIMDEAETRLFAITEDSVQKDFVHVAQLLEETYERAEDLNQNPDKIRGVPTGFGTLDNILGGFQNSDLIILAARPSVGKTALALDIARHIATREKKNVGFFSLEMSNLQLMDRLLSMEVGIGLWDLRMGKLPEKSFSKLADAMGILSESNLFIDDTPGINIMEIRTKARRLKAEKGLDMIVIDYLQLIEGRRKENRVQEVSEISRFLKVLARELSVPVLALSQLSRAVEQRTGGTPQLSDLRESGSIEQDADIVMFIHREELYDPGTERKGMADLIIAKHRNGPTGSVELKFMREQARYRAIDNRHIQS
ncbi:MAG TPA: replicative DNA helicase [Candidatus Dojkabacteria bacterium]|jgi:replicative DNA helicase